MALHSLQIGYTLAQGKRMRNSETWHIDEGGGKPQEGVAVMEMRSLTVSPYQAAARLGFGRQSVYRLLREGKLRATKLGRNWRIPVAALEQALADPERLNLGGEEGAAE